MKLMNSFTIVAALSLTLFACGEKAKTETKDTTPNVPTVRTDGLKIAFYNQDSLTKHFEYYVEMDSMMKSKQLKFQAELQKRQTAIQNFAAKYDAQMKAGTLDGFQLQSAQEEVNRKQQSLMQYQETEGMKLEKETGELLSVISKKIEDAGRRYSEKHGLDLLMMHGSAGQFIYVNPKMDVTTEFIEYLNQNEDEIAKDLGKK